MKMKQENIARTFNWVYSFLALVGLTSTVFLAGDRWPGWLVAGWLAIVYLACWGLGWSIANLSEPLKKRTINGPRRLTGEIWFWLVVSLCTLTLACWRLGNISFLLLPVIVLFVAANALLKRCGVIVGLIRGAGSGVLSLLGWSAMQHSLYQAQDLPVWLLVGFLVLWLTGYHLMQRALELKMESPEHQTQLRFDWARIVQMFSIAPLFFLGQMKSMGVIYGIALFLILVVSESQHRILYSQKVDLDQKQKPGIYLLIGILLWIACVFGRLV